MAGAGRHLLMLPRPEVRAALIPEEAACSPTTDADQGRRPDYTYLVATRTAAIEEVPTSPIPALSA